MRSEICHGFSPVATEPVLANCSQFCIGGITVSMTGERSADVALISSLHAFQVEGDSSDIDVHVEWVPELAVVSSHRQFDSGTTWRLYGAGDGFQFDFNAALFGDRPFKRLLIDRHFERARLQMSEECAALLSQRPEPLGYPLDELLIMHRLTQEKAIELHGCGIVGADGIGNLFVGHSGAGKSTTTRLWTALEDVEVLSDDRIIVRRDEDKLDSAIVKTPLEAGANSSEHGVLRLRNRSALPIGYSAQDDSKNGMRMYGTPWHGEAMYASPNSAPLARIFVLEHGHGNVLTPLSPSQAVAELFARSFVPFHGHEYVDAALEFLQELVDAVPVYRYAFEPDQRAIDTILNFHD
jgi:hypothetical protein